MKSNLFKKSVIESFEGQKFLIMSDGSHEAVNKQFNSSELDGNPYIYNCILFNEIEGEFIIDFWNESHSFKSIIEMQKFINKNFKS